MLKPAMRYKLLGLFSFAAWCLIGAWWYVCKIKYLCCEGERPCPPGELQVVAAADSTRTDSLAFVSDSIAVDTMESAPKPSPAATVDLPQKSIDFHFSSDTSAPLPEGSIDELVAHYKAVLASDPSLKLLIAGHTDSRGSNAYNQALSERRAQAVADRLVAAGIDPTRIQTIGHGEDRPVASNDTPEGRAQNRRAEITAQP